VRQEFPASRKIHAGAIASGFGSLVVFSKPIEGKYFWKFYTLRVPLTPLGLLRQMALSQIVASVAVGTRRYFRSGQTEGHKLRKLRIYSKLNFRLRSGDFLFVDLKQESLANNDNLLQEVPTFRAIE